MNEELQKRFSAALDRLQQNHPEVVLRMQWTTLTVIISQMQLALRHPGNKGWSAKRATDWLKKIIDMVEKLEPDLAIALRMGFQPEHDVQT